MEHIEIRLSGSGGQGLITAGIILAEAALMDGLNAIQSQSYGPEARGGASKAEVIISRDEIDYPKVSDCDILLSLTQMSCDKYVGQVKSGGTLIVDDSVNKPSRSDITIISVPILSVASEKLNKPMVANIVALGVIYKVMKLISKESLEEAVLGRVPKGTEELNKKALAEGFKLLR